MKKLTILAIAVSASTALGVALFAPLPAQAQQGQGGPDLGQMLIQGLQETQGCLGVDAARWNSGKNSIVAWFENKAAAKRWYMSPTHAHVMGMIGATPRPEKALEHVTDEAAPIMVIATLTFSEKPELEGVSMPISQISIEMFAPLPGGAHLNGRLSPESFKVPHMRDYAAWDPEKGEGQTQGY